MLHFFQNFRLKANMNKRIKQDKQNNNEKTHKYFYAFGNNWRGKPRYFKLQEVDGEMDYTKNPRLSTPVYPSNNETGSDF